MTDREILEKIVETGYCGGIICSGSSGGCNDADCPLKYCTEHAEYKRIGMVGIAKAKLKEMDMEALPKTMDEYIDMRVADIMESRKRRDRIMAIEAEIDKLKEEARKLDEEGWKTYVSPVGEALNAEIERRLDGHDG